MRFLTQKSNPGFCASTSVCIFREVSLVLLNIISIPFSTENDFPIKLSYFKYRLVKDSFSCAPELAF